MISRSALITLFVLLFAAASFGQGFVVQFHNLTDPLMTECWTGTPLPDGTPVYIWVDPELDGPSADDFQPPVGDGDGEVNYNTFPINGVQNQDGPGFFNNNPAFTCAGVMPDYDPYFYLVVCAGDEHYYSSTVIATSGPNWFYFYADEMVGDFWTCVNSPCDFCEVPTPPTDLLASTNLCNGINLTWNHDGENLSGFQIMRLIDGINVVIATTDVIVPPFSYLDTGAPELSSMYRVQAMRVCPDASMVLSPLSIPAVGNRLAGAPTPLIMFVTDSVCNRVDIGVMVNTTQGLDEIRVYRVGTPDVLIETIPEPIAGEVDTIEDNDPPEGEVCYYAVGYSEFCQTEGTHSASVCGEAWFSPACIPVITSASTTLCDRITIAWTYNCDDADSFHIRRNAVIIATVAGNVFTHDDSGTAPGINAEYSIVPVNECGSGTPSVVVTGQRAPLPAAVTGVNTIPGCNCITVNWTALAGTIVDYRVYRNNVFVGTVTPPTVTFEDCSTTLVPGTQYAYNVTASNVCGEGPHSQNANGSLLPQNSGGATLAVVSAGPPNWDYSLTWVSGCVNTLIIRDLCPQTTGSFTGTGWTATALGDTAIMWTADNPLDEDQGVVTGFRLTNTTDCAGTGRYTAGSGEGSVEGPLPVGRVREIPKEYALSVYPNPFNPTTTLEISLPKAGMVHVNVYDIIGRLVTEVVSGELEAGFHKVSFDATSLPSGLYFARINSRDFVTTKKLMLVK